HHLPRPLPRRFLRPAVRRRFLNLHRLYWRGPRYPAMGNVPGIRLPVARRDGSCHPAGVRGRLGSPLSSFSRLGPSSCAVQLVFLRLFWISARSSCRISSSESYALGCLSARADLSDGALHSVSRSPDPYPRWLAWQPLALRPTAHSDRCGRARPQRELFGG